ncbi:MAG: Hsp20/alpha crystallin family protein [Candidatus Sabulitectum sp.]|nr:Hsp20/alpha crystallin family protein [Candidatus Sabulitectum sp.]
MYRNTDNWIIHADVYGTAERFEIFVEMPGVHREDIELEVTPLAVKVWGVRKTLCPGATALAIEIQTGRFQREIHLPYRVDTSSVSAELKSGVLHIKLVRQKPVRVVVPVQSEGSNNL